MRGRQVKGGKGGRLDLKGSLKAWGGRRKKKTKSAVGVAKASKNFTKGKKEPSTRQKRLALDAKGQKSLEGNSELGGCVGLDNRGDGGCTDLKKPKA